MKPSACERFRSLVSDLAAGVDLAEGPYRAHVTACEDCESWAQSVLWQDRVLAELAGEARIELLLGRVRAVIGGTAPAALQAETPPPLRVRRHRPAWPRRLAKAAAIVLVGLGAWLVFRRPAPPPTVPEIVETTRTQEPTQDVEAAAPAPQDERAPVVHDEAPAPPPPPPAPAEKRPETTAKAVEDPQPKHPEPPVPAKAEKKVQVRPKDQVEARAPEIDLGPRTTEQAMRLAVTYLRGKCEGLENLKANRDLRSTELVLWTMLHAGVPEADPDVQRLLRQVLEKKLESTYAVALQAMVLEELDRVTYQWRIQQCAQFLVDNQGRTGLWSYGAPSIFVEDIPTGPKTAAARRTPPELDASGKPKVVRRVEVRKKREVADGGDHSNSMYAALGLRACHDAGVRIPREVAELAQRAWRDSQIKGEGGWCYGRHEAQGHKPYGSMTSGGVGSLVIYDYILGRDWRRDREVRAGMDWLARNFSATWNPGTHEHARAENSGHHLYYYLYALERAAILYGTDHIGKKDWYAEGSKALLGAQRPDGTWQSKDGGNELHDTCFAVLFLAKAARELLPDVPTGARK